MEIVDLGEISIWAYRFLTKARSEAENFEIWGLGRFSPVRSTSLTRSQYLSFRLEPGGEDRHPTMGGGGRSADKVHRRRGAQPL